MLLNLIYCAGLILYTATSEEREARAKLKKLKEEAEAAAKKEAEEVRSKTSAKLGDESNLNYGIRQPPKRRKRRRKQKLRKSLR
jgi:ArsR family metal-binding transcriptional regulator